ncbi:tRNA (adenine(37)-N6)-methyltransferase isoform X1 [Carcharodon carcharias]|uniref:tRNA (adenine(37)-N6)-methyltransferase isoform X1 n=1 Tax=Carcharodon carcharias TaxID=13397 RepID=UPI001B7EF3BA|nr:tRNA (adenine(37)-N6)-methyltransferase isoform X1 [Carcharodon carcharias]XP_041042888.1 tRNA (adenine(37)-N6)-methyltransferase isoform X1 [Carcharodon carcharias]
MLFTEPLWNENCRFEYIHECTYYKIASINHLTEKSRQQVNKAVHVHKKSIEDLHTLLKGLKKEPSQDYIPIRNRDDQVSQSLEKGNIRPVPIGYIESCFTAKNGTPRQPTICSLSRARLKISKAIFNNAEHSLMGLNQFSHVWIIFVFHKNGHQSYKAKVKPPRLNGLKTGVFSTRSPHRPNAIGLTLAKLDRIEGDTLYFSGIDMIQGTPVLDIKPYIPDYDTPKADPPRNDSPSHQEILVPDEQCEGITIPVSRAVTMESGDKEPAHVKVAPEIGHCFTERVQHAPRDATHPFRKMDADFLEGEDQSPIQVGATILPYIMDETTDKEEFCVHDLKTEKVHEPAGKEGVSDENILLAMEKIKRQLFHNDIINQGTAEDKVVCMESEQSGAATLCQNKWPKNLDAISVPGNQSSNSTIATWVKQSPVTSLQVRFTPHAELDLKRFQAPSGTDPGKISLKYFQSVEEAKSAIVAVLSADPRSIYRRKQCQDVLFYFTVDTAHITSWFGDDFAEILRIKPVKEKA